jgi:hypothetical protein
MIIACRRYTTRCIIPLRSVFFFCKNYRNAFMQILWTIVDCITNVRSIFQLTVISFTEYFCNLPTTMTHRSNKLAYHNVRYAFSFTCFVCILRELFRSSCREPRRYSLARYEIRPNDNTDIITITDVQCTCCSCSRYCSVYALRKTTWRYGTARVWVVEAGRSRAPG